MKNTLIIILILISTIAFSQSKKKIKENGYTTKTEYKHEFRAGKEKKIKISETTFNKNGGISVLKEFDEFGKIEKHIAYFYSEKGNKTKEVYYLPNGKLKRTIKYKYNKGFKIEKAIYDANDKIKSKKTFVYEK